MLYPSQEKKFDRVEIRARAVKRNAEQANNSNQPKTENNNGKRNIVRLNQFYMSTTSPNKMAEGGHKATAGAYGVN